VVASGAACSTESATPDGGSPLASDASKPPSLDGRTGSDRFRHDGGSLLVDAAYDFDGSFVTPPSEGGSRQMQHHGVWLHASGAGIVDVHGNPVRLVGVNRSGTEYACVQDFGIFDGPSDAASIQAITSWGANAVRVPLNEDCWLGINGVNPAYAGAAYQSAIAGYVELLLANGVFPILDLHWTAPGTTLATGQEPMPDQDHSVTFWTEVATAYRGSANVIFELFNEAWPDDNQDTDDAWTCWKSGGTCSQISYPVAGMQSLLTAVRSTGAGNLVLLGGVEYSNGLSQWLTYLPTDPASNVAAAWHIYPENPCNDVSCWQGAPTTVAQSFPIVATEVGDSACDGTFPTTVMSFLDGLGPGQNYLAWAWDTFGDCSNYALVTDYSGTPNGAYGMAFRSHFMGLAH
jgi:hypothetical protein